MNQDEDLPFQPEDKLVLTPSTGGGGQLYPEISCEHARKLMDKVDRGAVTVGERVVLAFHMADDERDHEATCDFHDPTTKQRINIGEIFAEG